MRLLTFVAGATVAAGIFAAGGSTASAQVQTNTQSKSKAAKQIQQYTVAEGDTLINIADTYQTTYVRIFDANNNIENPDLIYPGDNLRIPEATEQLADREIPADYAAANPISAASSSSVASTITPLPTQSAPVSGCGDNSYANYIYSHESGCRTTAMSSNGCYGIGQACPASKIAYCGSDYACQNAFFSAYAGKYGGWEGAYNFWVSHGWW